MSSLKLSMVVCSFNQARYLERTLRSLTGQRDVSPSEYEIIVVDGGSTDGSVDIIRSLESHFASWVSEKDRGQTHALKKGFEKASGNILGWLCSDDVLEPNAVRQVLDYFSAHPATRFVYGDALMIDENDNVLRKQREIAFNWFIWKYDHNYIPQPSTFWTKDLYDEAGGLDETFDVAMDGDLFGRFAAISRPHHVPYIWSRFRLQPEQKTQVRRHDHEVAHALTCSRIGAPLQQGAVRHAAFVLAKTLRVCWRLSIGAYVLPRKLS